MTTLQQLQQNPKLNAWGSLGSRNRCPVAVNVRFNKGVIWCVDSAEAIYSYHEESQKFNGRIPLLELSEEVLVQINAQVK